MPPKKIKSRKARKTNVKDLPLASLNLAEQPEHDIEINETKYAIESVYDPKSDYSHYVLNFVISNCVANNPQIRFIEIGRELQYLRGNLQAFKNNLQQTIVIIPIRPMGDNGQERQHFAGLYIGRNGAQFSAF